MKSSRSLFNRKKLELKPLSERKHDLDLSVILPLSGEGTRTFRNLDIIADRIVQAKKRDASVVLMMGGHVIRSGVQKFIIDLMERGLVSCVAMNGSCVIHDYELSLIGATTESVARYISEGQFGLWKETGHINDIINRIKVRTTGFGRAVGKAIHEGAFPHKDISILAAGYRLDIPVTVHIGIGYDIIHEHPNFDGAASGAASYTDFLRFTGIIERLEGGVVMNFGSAVMAPEIYLKALSMSRNAARQEGRKICHFTSLVCDLHDLPEDASKEADKGSAAYYFRPWKTMLVRTVADGGQGFYVKGRHGETLPSLWNEINKAEKK
jgi:hypothetical protein